LAALSLPDALTIYTLQMLAAALAVHGANVACAASADDALATLATFPADVLMSDIRMPDKDGYALIEEVRARRDGHGQRLAAVALTADAGLADRERARRAGFVAHLAKPVDPHELAATLAALLPRSSVARR
jgi:CheY-like chemotaxis protein